MYLFSSFTTVTSAAACGIRVLTDLGQKNPTCMYISVCMYGLDSDYIFSYVQYRWSNKYNNNLLHILVFCVCGETIVPWRLPPVVTL